MSFTISTIWRDKHTLNLEKKYIINDGGTLLVVDPLFF